MNLQGETYREELAEGAEPQDLCEAADKEVARLTTSLGAAELEKDDWKRRVGRVADLLRRFYEPQLKAAKQRTEKAEAALGEMRPEVRAFALAMEERLQANAWKNGWKDCRPGWLIVRLYEEVEELDQARARRDGPAVRYEAADVGNFAMMVADLCGGLILEGREEKP